MSVHYKFKSALDFDTIKFDGLHISVADLKKAIVQQKKLGKSVDFDLQITNAQTKEEYNDETSLIPKNTSLIVARVPLILTGKRQREQLADKVPQPRPVPKEDAIPMDIASMTGTEDEKIAAMMKQSTAEYDPTRYQKMRGGNQVGEVPSSYRCHRCHKSGHWIKNCPLGPFPRDHQFEKRSTGIPRSFIEGNKQQELLAVEPVVPDVAKEVPEDLICSICNDLFTDAVMIPCCGSSFCDECVRTALLESEDNECPDCKEHGISPTSLIPNRFIRTSVNNFKSDTGYVTKPKKRPEPVKSIEEESQDKMTTPRDDEATRSPMVQGTSPDANHDETTQDSTRTGGDRTPATSLNAENIESRETSVERRPDSPQKITVLAKNNSDVDEGMIRAISTVNAGETFLNVVPQEAYYENPPPQVVGPPPSGPHMYYDNRIRHHYQTPYDPNYVRRPFMRRGGPPMGMRPRYHQPMAPNYSEIYQNVTQKIGTGVIDDPLEMFNRFMKEKERRHAGGGGGIGGSSSGGFRRRSKSPPPRRRRSRSPDRRGGGTRTHRRKRSNSYRSSKSYSRSRSRTPPRRKSNTPRRRSRSPARGKRSRSPGRRRGGGGNSPRRRSPESRPHIAAVHHGIPLDLEPPPFEHGFFSPPHVVEPMQPPPHVVEAMPPPRVEQPPPPGLEDAAQNGEDKREVIPKKPPHELEKELKAKASSKSGSKSESRRREKSPERRKEKEMKKMISEHGSKRPVEPVVRKEKSSPEKSPEKEKRANRERKKRKKEKDKDLVKKSKKRRRSKHEKDKSKTHTPEHQVEQPPAPLPVAVKTPPREETSAPTPTLAPQQQPSAPPPAAPQQQQPAEQQFHLVDASPSPPPSPPQQQEQQQQQSEKSLTPNRRASIETKNPAKTPPIIDESADGPEIELKASQEDMMEAFALLPEPSKWERDDEPFKSPDEASPPPTPLPAPEPVITIKLTPSPPKRPASPERRRPSPDRKRHRSRTPHRTDTSTKLSSAITSAVVKPHSASITVSSSSSTSKSSSRGEKKEKAPLPSQPNDHHNARKHQHHHRSGGGGEPRRRSRSPPRDKPPRGVKTTSSRSVEGTKVVVNTSTHIETAPPPTLAPPIAVDSKHGRRKHHGTTSEESSAGSAAAAEKHRKRKKSKKKSSRRSSLDSSSSSERHKKHKKKEKKKKKSRH